jgi:hypothetical protein
LSFLVVLVLVTAKTEEEEERDELVGTQRSQIGSEKKVVFSEVRLHAILASCFWWPIGNVLIEVKESRLTEASTFVFLFKLLD